MRPISFFSAALCGVLCALSIPFASAAGPVLPGQLDVTRSPECPFIFNGKVHPCPTTTVDDTHDPPTSTPTVVMIIPPSPTPTGTPPSPTPADTPLSITGQPTETTSARQSTSAVQPIGTGQSPIGTVPDSKPTAQGGSKTGAVVGGVVGGIFGVALILGVVGFFLWRRRRQSAASAGDFSTLEKNLVSPSPPVYTIPGTAYSPPPLQPQQSPAPPITAVESHHLMGSYSEPSHQHQGSGGITPVGGAEYAGAAGYAGAPGYAVGNQREREVDEDGVSLRSPSPVQDGGRAGERDSVPRLPIYNRGTGNADRGPAL